MKVLFLIQKAKVNKKGLVPILCRITFHGNRKEFSTGILIQAENWIREKQQVNPKASNSRTTNQRLEQINIQLEKIKLSLEVQEKNFDAGDIYRLYKGDRLKKEMGVVAICTEHNEYYKRLVGTELKLVSWQKFENTKYHLRNFIRWKYSKSDVHLASLQLQFIRDMEYYLAVEQKMQQSSINKTTQRFKKMIVFAIAHGYLTVNPFLLHKPKTVKPKITYLTVEELKLLESRELGIKRLEEVRDCFIFCCYTGLAFKEMTNLRTEHLVTTPKGDPVIKIVRQKTNRTLYVPLLPRAIQILEKYTHESKRLLPIRANAHFNAYLKEIATLCEIDKRLTHHVARKTFATTVLLLNNVPLEIVSKLLGHSRIGITQAHYGEILNQNVEHEINRISCLL